MVRRKRFSRSKKQKSHSDLVELIPAMVVFNTLNPFPDKRLTNFDASTTNDW
jgi:hypothetical protein